MIGIDDIPFGINSQVLNFEAMMPPVPPLRVLTCNSHEAYIWALAKVNIHLDIIDNLPGRYTSSWDSQMRPIPQGSSLITLDQACAQIEAYDCFIGHSISDLLLVKTYQLPKILLIHDSLLGYQAQEKNLMPVTKIQEILRTYLKKIRGTAVSISRMKQDAWGVKGPIIPHYIDYDYFNGYVGNTGIGLRVANQFNAKGIILKSDFHYQLAQQHPVSLVGFNPDIPGSNPSKNLDDLRERYRKHRYYVHTAEPGYEDGYNLASLEAMSVGMPVLCNDHPSTPIKNGVNGFTSHDPQVLSKYAQDLINDLDLATHLGQAARTYVMEHHSFDNFNKNWLAAISESIAHFSS